MRLAVSNIAWSSDHDDSIAPVLISAGADLLEVAPGRLFPSPVQASETEIQLTKAIWQDRGLSIVSMQALLFGQPDLDLFTETGTSDLVDYLKVIFDVAQGLGAGPLVFGSPKNRLKRQMTDQEALERSLPIFRQIGDLAEERGLVFCLEANAPAYGCDFMTTLDNAAEVARRVDHSAVGLIVDTGNMALVDDLPETAASHVDIVKHLHLSRPKLAPLHRGDDQPKQVLNALRLAGYTGDVTVEMRPDEDDQIEAVKKAVGCARAWVDADA